MVSTTITIESPASTNGWVPEPSRLRKLPKELAMRSMGRLGAWLHRCFGDRCPDPLGILMYHRVADHVRGLPAPLHNVRPNRFREQLVGLKRRGYRFWPLRKALEYRECGATILPKTLVVTFDDGFQSIYTNAWPVLQELEIPAAVFVNTAYVDQDEPFPFDAWGVKVAGQAPPESYRPLTTEQCREMSASGLIEIGAHTHTHIDYRGRPSDFRNDLQQSVDIVRERFAVDRPAFAFPYGGRHTGFSSDELAAAAKQTGVACGLTTECAAVDPRTDPFVWGRFNAFPWDTSATLAAKLAGWYSWAPKLKQRVTRALLGRAKSRGAK